MGGSHWKNKLMHRKYFFLTAEIYGIVALPGKYQNVK